MEAGHADLQDELSHGSGILARHPGVLAFKLDQVPTVVGYLAAEWIGFSSLVPENKHVIIAHIVEQHETMLCEIVNYILP